MLDFRRVNIIRNAPIETLKDISGVESIIFQLGLNAEASIELPTCVIKNKGGLYIWQYPNQFSKYLVFLSSLLPIKSYLEIGCRWGGTFILTHEYLSRFNSMERSIALDIMNSPVQNYCSFTDNCEFKLSDSHSSDFADYMKNNWFDMIFIDGDHSYNGVKSDYEFSKHSGRIFVFHDIVNAGCEGVVRFWNELKNNSADIYNFYEFTDQYEEVTQRLGVAFLGIGVVEISPEDSIFPMFSTHYHQHFDFNGRNGGN